MLNGTSKGPTGEQRGDAGESWQVAHAALVELARERAGLDFEEGRWLLAAKLASVERQLGYASFFEYAERLFGYKPRVTEEKIRVAQALSSCRSSRARSAMAS